MNKNDGLGQVVTAAHCVEDTDADSISVKIFHRRFILFHFLSSFFFNLILMLFPFFIQFFLLILCHRLSLGSTPSDLIIMFPTMTTTMISGLGNIGKPQS